MSALEAVFLDVDLAVESESHFFVDLTGDVGHAGVFVATWRDLPIGSAIVIGSRFPDGPIVMTGRVRWLRDASGETGPGIGVVLEGLSEEDVARIARFCDAQPPYYYEVEAA
ncbi:MAG: PilZ domain-containing protein [Polyangiaceae bacterium]|jgi:Tfp pilus assembly protein PilZ